MKKVQFSFYILIVWMFSCKSDELVVPITEDPKLNAAFNVESKNLDLIAGIDGYYMSTFYIQDIDSSVSHGVGQFAGKIHHYDAEQTNDKIEFRIRNFHTGLISNEDLDLVLQQDELNYYGSDDEVFYKVEFSVDQQILLAQDATWDFGDGSVGVGTFTTHLYKKGENDKYTVCVDVVYSDGCTDKICSEVIPFSADCGAKIAVERDSSNVIFKTENIFGRAPYRYEWTFENGVTANTSEVKFVYGPSTSFIEHAQLKVLDANNCPTNVAFKYNVGNSGKCYTNFSYIPKGEVVVQDVLGYNEVEIIYTDQLGNEYSSYKGAQPANSHFKILSSGDFILNYEDLPTKFLDVKFDCVLYNTLGNTLNLTTGEGRIAFAYPE